MHGTARNIASMIHRDRIEGAYSDIQAHHPDPAVKKYWRDWKANLEDPASPFSRLAGGASQAAFYWTLAANPSSSIIIALHSPQVAHSMLAMGLGNGPAGLGAGRAGKELYGALFNGGKAPGFDPGKGLQAGHATRRRADAGWACAEDRAQPGGLRPAGARRRADVQRA